VGTNASFQRHGVRHEPTDASIAIGKWMNEVQAMVTDRDGRNATGDSQRCQTKATFEVVHERGYRSARWWDMPSDHVVVMRVVTKAARLHEVRTARARNRQQLLRQLRIKLLVYPADESLCRWFTQRALGATRVDGLLNANVRACLELQIAPVALFFELIGERSLDIARASVVTLDQIAVVTIHHADQIRETAGSTRMEPRSERRSNATIAEIRSAKPAE
jgi:hypothetical protein